MSDWKPGDDVAAWSSGRKTGTADGDGLGLLGRQRSVQAMPWPQHEARDEVEFGGLHQDAFAAPRPLVVIDPEDAEQVERLMKTIIDKAPSVVVRHNQGGRHIEWRAASLAAALREFAAPTPPKPDEPQGLGAVVEDAKGVLWTRNEYKTNLTGTVWISAYHPTLADESVMREYSDIDVVRVLSEGVTP